MTTDGIPQARTSASAPHRRAVHAAAAAPSGGAGETAEASQRSERVAELGRQVAAGTYSVDAREVAAAVLRRRGL